MIPLVGIGLFGAFVGVLIWIGRKQHRRLLVNLEALAQRHGLKLVLSRGMTNSRQVVEGAVRGRTVRFWSFATGGGKSRQFWVAVGVQPRRVGAFTFRIEPQGIAARLAELFGAKEIQVGDPRFDEAWFVRTSHPAEFGAGLLPEIREKLMAARAAGAKGEFKCEDGFVFYVQNGFFSKDETVALLESMLPLLSDLADVAEVCAAE
ncbi:MAG: hypothetical protein C0518_01465 [Opitutus sp.]|nr:hypothetical protein [Opitutus sp.]